MRIDRRVRIKPPKVRGLWPAPRTAEGSVEACRHATLEELLEGRRLLKATQATDENKWPIFGLSDAISRELEKRFRERVEAGMSEAEISEWSEILGDPKFVAWHVSRKAQRIAEEKETAARAEERRRKIIEWKV
jgi:hypothetical protein